MEEFIITDVRGITAGVRLRIITALKLSSVSNQENSLLGIPFSAKKLFFKHKYDLSSDLTERYDCNGGNQMNRNVAIAPIFIALTKITWAHNKKALQ